MYIIVKNAKARSDLDVPLLSYSGTIGDVLSIPPAMEYRGLTEASDDCRELNRELGSTLFFVVSTGDSYKHHFASGAITAFMGHFPAEHLEKTLQVIITGKSDVRLVYDTGDVRAVFDILDLDYPGPHDLCGYLKLINRKTSRITEKKVSLTDYFLMVTGQDLWTQHMTRLVEHE